MSKQVKFRSLNCLSKLTMKKTKIGFLDFKKLEYKFMIVLLILEKSIEISL